MVDGGHAPMNSQRECIGCTTKSTPSRCRGVLLKLYMRSTSCTTSRRCTGVGVHPHRVVHPGSLWVAPSPSVERVQKFIYQSWHYYLTSWRQGWRTTADLETLEPHIIANSSIVRQLRANLLDTSMWNYECDISQLDFYIFFDFQWGFLV